jgi:ribosomal subunit interface protein
LAALSAKEVLMDIEIHARRVEIAEDMRAAAKRKTERLSRYLTGVERADVFFSNGQPGHLSDPVTCEVVLVGHGHVVRASAGGPGPETALDSACRKAELRLTKLKTRLVERSRPKHASGKRPAAPRELFDDEEE